MERIHKVEIYFIGVGGLGNLLYFRVEFVWHEVDLDLYVRGAIGLADLDQLAIGVFGIVVGDAEILDGCVDEGADDFGGVRLSFGYFLDLEEELAHGLVAGGSQFLCDLNLIVFLVVFNFEFDLFVAVELGPCLKHLLNRLGREVLEGADYIDIVGFDVDIVGFELVEFILEGLLGFVEPVDFFPLVPQLIYQLGNGSLINITLFFQLIMFLLNILKHILIRLMLCNIVFQFKLFFFTKLLG